MYNFTCLLKSFNNSLCEYTTHITNSKGYFVIKISFKKTKINQTQIWYGKIN